MADPKTAVPGAAPDAAEKPAVKASEKKVTYKIVGLKDADKMPVEHKGRMYDLKKISDADADRLIKDGFEFLKKG